MVKTPRGRVLGRRHARIMKKLRHRRQRAASRMAHELEQLSASTPDTVSTASTSSSFNKLSPSSFAGAYGIAKEGEVYGVLERSRELNEERVEDTPRRLYFADSEVNCLSTYDESEQGIPAAKKMSNRGASESEAAVIGNGAKNVDRSSVSESGLHEAIPMPPPPTPNEEEEVVVVQARAAQTSDRAQHPDEETDRYLSHLFAPSVANITTTTALGEVDTRSDEFQRLRNLFSTVTSDNTSSTRPETLPGLRHYSSHDTGTYGLRSLFAESARHQEDGEVEKFKPGLPSVVSEQSLGLNTLFNNTRTAENNGISSSETSSSMGLRTLFEEGFNEEGQSQQSAPESTASTLGLRTLFNQEEREAAGNLLRSTASTLGLRTLFLHDGNNNNGKEDEAQKSFADMPSLKSSSSLLGNLFGSEHAIHGNGNDGSVDPNQTGDEALSVKERMKVLIAQDLAQYLEGDGTTSASGRHSSSLSTFVQQIDNLFANYRLAVKQIERLEKEFARTKKDQQKE